MPWFEVKVKASQLIAVEAEDAGEAAMIAFNEAFDGELECDKECDHPKEPVTGDALDSLKRHANLVLPDGDGE